MKKAYYVLLLIVTLSINSFSQDFWEEIPLPEGINVNDVFGVDENTIIICGTAGLYISYDDGLTWKHEIESAFLMTLMNYENTYYAVSQGNIYRRYGVEEAWEQIKAKGHTSDYFCFINDTVIYSGGYQKILKTNDGGYEWNEIYNGQLNESFLSIAEHPSETLFAGSIRGSGSTISGLYRSNDEGDTWERIAFENYGIHFVRINQEGDIYVGAYYDPYDYGGGVFKSDDLGETWDSIKPNIFVSGLVVTHSDSIYVSSSESSNTGIHMSPDGGQTWQNITSNIEYPAISKLELGKDGHLYTISDGNEDKIYRSKKPVSVGIKNITSSSEEILNIYPNPAKNHLNVLFKNDHNEKHIFIYSMNGLLINSMVVASKQISIDVSNLPIGCYILQSYSNKHFKNQIFIKN